MWLKFCGQKLCKNVFLDSHRNSNNFFDRSQVCSKFSVDEHSHYLFTPRDLTQWILGLLRYELDSGSSEVGTETVLKIWAYEACRLFRDKLVGNDAKTRFDGILGGVLQSEWNAGHLLQDLGGMYVNVVLFI